ncbi:hypothetical protein, partial [Piscinibacter sp.]|uniref:hypothetical protein n=1 Tax=Piscinibacter sp. TaxID=1903157 RepID=UPI002BB9C5C4
AQPQPSPVKDPHYGDALFHFFADDHFTAITTLMASQHFERVPQHADEAEVLRGGMLLSYGLHRQAGEIFAQLIDKGAAPPVRDRAWFYLAKIRYQRGFAADAEAALARIGAHLPPELEEERHLLKANLLMARADYAGAADVLGGIADTAKAAAYARYNLGVALIRSGDTARGAALLDALGRSPTTSATGVEEFRSLRDQANVALGFAALKDDRAEEARTYLQRVRLNGMHSNKALLGFGWAAASLKDPKLALVPWTELAQRDTSDSAVLEARIAVPYAYAELQAFGQSLQRYQDAIAAFERESAGLDESIAAIRSGKLVAGLLDSNPGEEMGWFRQIRHLPEMPHAAHLAQVLARHEFQEAFKNFRDLRFLSRNLQHWQDNLGVFGDMLANRRNAYAERLPKVREAAQASGTGLDGLQQRRDALAQELATAEAAADGLAFADEKQRDLLARLATVSAILKSAGTEPEFAAAHERARLAAGALTWQLAQDHYGRLWEAKKALVTTDTQLAEARLRDAALAQAQQDEPQRFEQFAGRIDTLAQRLQALIPQVAALSGEQQQAVQDIAVAELTRQKERLAVYTMQARYAVAQLYDRASVARKSDDAAAQ